MSAVVDELERHVADAFADDADRRPVEVAALLAGAGRGARRHRRRRAGGAAVLAALVVVAVPVGTGALTGGDDPGQVAAGPVGPDPTRSGPTSPDPTSPGPTSSPAPTALLVEPTTGGGAAAAEPTAPVPPTESPVNPDVPDGLAGTVLVPPEAMLGPGDLPFTPTETNDHGPYLKNRTMVTSLCGDGVEPGDDLAVGGRQIFYIGSGQDALATTVRVFSGDGAQQQLAFLRASLGTCDYAGTTYTPQDAGGLLGDDALIGTSPSAFVGDGTAVIGAVRDGNTTVGVQIDLEGDADAATATARDLLTLAHERLAASGLPAAHPG